MQESNFNVIIDTENYTTVIGESAKIDVGQAINNVQSGKAEIEAAVQDGKAAKTNAFNQNATDKTNAFNNNANAKTQDFNDNAVAKTGDFDTNATNKTTAFNNNATAKTGDFNDNYTAKKGLIDAQVAVAEGAAALAKQWAIGDPSEPTGNSAKYWAEQASSSLSGLTSRVTTIEGKIPADASSSNQLADKDWVGNQGYITGITSGDVTTALGYTPYNSTNPDGYISGITSGDVTTALGYTPYDASNPSGYTSNIGTVTSVNNTSPDGNGNVTLVIPDSLPSQTGHSGEYLTTDGTDMAWASVAVLPSQSGQSGKFLTTDGTDASWAAVSTRNIGEIIASTIPLTDAGLHLLDGALLQGSGAYGDFVTYIAGLVSDYPDMFDTEANWQTAVTTYGVCGKFVYDDVNGTVRLPKISKFIEGTLDVTKLGDLVEAGLPNITGSITEMMSRNQTITATGALSTGTVTAFKPSSGSYNLGHADVNIDASASSSIYGNSSTVQPQAIKVLYYIVVANSTKTQIEVDIDEVMTDLNGKADVDLSNVNNTGKSLGAGWAMPSDTYDDLTLGASGTEYTAPANGYFVFCKVAGASNKYIDIHNTTTQMAQQAFSAGSDNWLRINCPVKVGDIVQIDYNVTGDTKFFRFIYAQGEV